MVGSRLPVRFYVRVRKFAAEPVYSLVAKFALVNNIYLPNKNMVYYGKVQFGITVWVYF